MCHYELQVLCICQFQIEYEWLFNCICIETSKNSLTIYVNFFRSCILFFLFFSSLQQEYLKKLDRKYDLLTYLLIFAGRTCLPGFDQIIGEIQSETMYLETHKTESIPQ